MYWRRDAGEREERLLLGGMSEGEGDGDELEEGEVGGEGRNVTALDPRGGEAWHLSTVCCSLIPSLTFGSFSISPELLKAG